ncbi:hypothetical protein INS49_008016 [Diaporthe citri]|uniref:uncharacterized protein n=1 Tax=Diaporthe citri TaxID=83186 RepID=UPI001C7F47FC|nr:uncharacterized protein INS49_008016 [Diaporthe citri]KAG6362921.1 hypothetical protein INS49_008016 [Diaporthe citri]
MSVRVHARQGPGVTLGPGEDASVGQSIASSSATDALELGAEFFPHLDSFAAPRHPSTEEALVTTGPALLQAGSQA